ncbi:hypothetical protein POF51_22285 [Brevibacillus sp. AG]|uniref:hypothetical protein n=1 Tax=Brevibacillus sp. AG TaxID=3020891 RepID=UPI002330EB70|nr:hypothetical protein [Brevibacillus sp. AG]MDC0763457.1 hypothetical protein [Brevibacillus sp. AG]
MTDQERERFMAGRERYGKALSLAWKHRIYFFRVYRELPCGGRSKTRYYQAHKLLPDGRWIKFITPSASESIERVAAELGVAL